MAVGSGCAVVVLVVEVEEDAEVVEDVEDVESEDVVDVVVCSAGSVTSSSDEQAASESTATIANSSRTTLGAAKPRKCVARSMSPPFTFPT